MPAGVAVSGRAWKWIGLAGVAGVAATGVVLARNERRRRAFTPDEIRDRLHARYAEAEAAAVGPQAGDAGAPRVGGEASTSMAGALPDPERIARYETDAWVGYYRREWGKVLRGALGMVREGFGTSPLQTARGAWWVLRANQAWAPYPDNDPDAARSFMARFYLIAAAAQGWSIDPQEAARLEVAWWAAHRELQRETPGRDDGPLVAALADLYAYVYSRPAATMLVAARHRAAAMRLSDAWVEDGCRVDDPRLADEEEQLVLSYRALRVAVAGR